MDTPPPGRLGWTFADWLTRTQGAVSDNELARRVGVSATMIGKYKRGTPPKLETLRKFAEWSGERLADLEVLLPGAETDDPDVVDVWVVEGLPVSAGAPIGVGAHAGTYRVERPEERTHHFQMFKVAGDCMAPKIEAGDWVVVDTTRWNDWKSGDTVAVIHDGVLLVKRVYGSRETPDLVADDGTEVKPDGDTRIIGVVVEIRKRP